MAATREGVVNRRDEALAEIHKNREAEIDQELKAGGTAEGIAVLVRDVPEGDPLKPADIPVEDWDAMSDEQKNNAITDAKRAAEGADKPEVVETEEEKAAREAEEAKAAAASAKKVKVKVDGVEQEVDESEVLQVGIRAMQKELAADKRLEEATKAKEEAERLRASAKAEVDKTAGVDRAAKKTEDVIASVEKLKPIVEKLQYGTPEEAAAALAEIVASTKSDGLSDTQISALVENELSIRESRAFVKANYSDILEDPRLKKIFVDEVNAKIAAGDSRSYQELCKEVGDDLKTWKAPQRQEATPGKAAGASRADVHQRKTSTVHVPSAAARQPAPSQPKAPSQTEVIEEMRKARRQA